MNYINSSSQSAQPLTPRLRAPYFSGMKCPFCGHQDDRVLDTRVQKEGAIRRRRECMQCKSRFATLETLILNYPMVVKKDGRREAFNKEKILNGVQASCQKRPISLLQLESLVERISGWLINRPESEISSQVIGRKVMAELKSIDDVAYVRFASVYRNFKDVQEFVETLEIDEFRNTQDLENPQLSLTPFSEGPQGENV